MPPPPPPPEQQSAVGNASDDDSDDLIIEEEDDAAFLEKARLRRQAILAKHTSSAPVTPSIGAGLSNATVVPDPDNTTRANSTDSPAIVTPADLSPVNLPETVTDTVTTAGVQDSEKPDSTIKAASAVEEDMDIFGSFDVAAAAAKNKSKTAKNHTADWADSEGYYKISAGEVLDKRYRVSGYMGSGVFSNVVKARDSSEHDIEVAIKIIRNNELMYNAGKKELEILRLITASDKDGRHHCVKYLRHFMHKGHLCMVFESCAMNLREVTKKYGRDDGEMVGLSMEAVRKFTQQLLLSLKLMRKCKIVHADIKPDNILVDESKTQVKLCDFGSACKLEDCEITEYLQSRFYRAPEVVLGEEYDYGIDMWSLATTLYELYTGRILFQDNKNNNQLLKQHMDLKGKPSAKFIRRGMAKAKHFDEDNAFLHHDIDPVTKKDKIRVLETIQPTVDLMHRLKKNQKLDEAQKRKLLQFKDLLDKMLVLDPSKRITPKDALKHDFVKLPMH